MKIRYDFVSNSSSCSFIIKDSAKFLKYLNLDFGEDYFLQLINDVITLTVTCLEKDAEELEEKLTGNTYKFKEYLDFDIEKKYKLTLEDKHEIYDVNLYKLFEHKDVLDKIINLSIQTAECNDQFEECILGLLFEYCKSIDLNPDDKVSEHNFQDIFAVKLLKTIIKNLFKKEN